MFWKQTKIFSLGMFVALAGLSCNDAPVGHNAESGASISISACPAISTNTNGLVLLTAFVKNSRGEPAQGYQIQFVCTTCDIYDRAPDENVTSPDLARLQAVSNPYFVASDSRGMYQLVVGVTAPANLGLGSYSATLAADIGVASASTSCAVSQM